MNNKIKHLCFIAAVLIVCGCTQNNAVVKEGYIIYKYQGVTDTFNGKTYDVYKTYYRKVYFKNGKTRIESIPFDGVVELNTGLEEITMANDTTAGFEIIHDTLFPTKPKGKYYTKAAHRPAPGIIEKMYKSLIKTTAEYTDEKKAIAGFECKKVIFHAPGDIDYRFAVWYTSKISPLTFSADEEKLGIKGCILEKEDGNGSNLQTSMVATEVFSGPVPDSLFVIPKEYKESP